MKTQVILNRNSKVFVEYDLEVVPMAKGQSVFYHKDLYVVVDVILDIDNDVYVILVE